MHDKLQRLEELAIKQSRQLIPMTPLMPKGLVKSTSLILLYFYKACFLARKLTFLHCILYLLNTSGISISPVLFIIESGLIIFVYEFYHTM